MALLPMLQITVPATASLHMAHCHIYLSIYICRDSGFPVSSLVKNVPAMQDTQVRSLGWEDPLEKEMATHSSTLAWRIPWREEPGRLQSMGSQRVGHDLVNKPPYI